jgi:hypothetical protein
MTMARRTTMNAMRTCVLATAAVAAVLSTTAWPAAAQSRARPSEEELRRREQQILDELKKADEQYDREREARLAGRGKKHPNLPPQDPCALLANAEVAAAIANAQPGKRDHFNDEHGISRCVWSSANGAPLLKLELSAVRSDRRDDDFSRLPAYRKLSGIGDEAAVWVLPRTPPALHHDMVVGAARKGPVGLQLQSIELAKQGPEPGTRAVERLLKTAADRL